MSAGEFEPGRVLVVDDEPATRYLLEIVLTTEGWLVEHADSGEAALQRCQEASFDLIVLDHWMPGLPGLEVAGRLLEEGWTTPIVLFSGFLDPELKIAGRRLGVEVIDKLNWKQLVAFCAAARSGEPAPYLVHAAR